MNSGYTSRGFESFDRGVDALYCSNALSNVANTATKIDTSLTSAIASIDGFAYKNDVVNKSNLLTTSFLQVLMVLLIKMMLLVNLIY